MHGAADLERCGRERSDREAGDAEEIPGAPVESVTKTPIAGIYEVFAGGEILYVERTGADLDGRVAIDWGVYGVPETFLVDREGRIAYKHIGPVTPQVVTEKLLPLIEQLRR